MKKYIIPTMNIVNVKIASNLMIVSLTEDEVNSVGIEGNYSDGTILSRVNVWGDEDEE
jgi:hypothetical protein